MKRKFKDMEKIEKYLDNQVDEQERTEVNNRLVSDEEFRRLFDEMEALLEGIKHTGAKTTVEEKLAILEDTMYKLEEDEGGGEEVELAGVGVGSQGERIPIVIVWYNRPVWRAVAASFLLLVAAIYVFGPFGTMSDERLFAENFKPYENLDGPTRGEVREIDERKQAYAYYDLGDYEASIPIFINILNESENQILDKFYLANAYLASGNGELSVDLFKEIANEKIGLAMSAKWYLALSYLQTGEREKARIEFDEIVETGSDYSEDSEKILSKMEK